MSYGLISIFSYGKDERLLYRAKTMNIGLDGLDNTINLLNTLITSSKAITAKQIRDDQNAAKTVKGTLNAVDELLSSF